MTYLIEMPWTSDVDPDNTMTHSEAFQEWALSQPEGVTMEDYEDAMEDQRMEQQAEIDREWDMMYAIQCEDMDIRREDGSWDDEPF